ncbi:MAG: hypothetical protein OES38_23485, partial [Gammaproteobacteria bacterium]|nr:hypothetical protein [Gammaproteobacteria bacterium]
MNAVVVEVGPKTPKPVYAQRVDLIDAEDREVREPYHVAGGWSGLERVPRPDDPVAVIRRGRRAQVRSAKSALATFRSLLEQAGFLWARGVVLTGRGRPGDDLERILASHAHIHVAEGEAIRDATRSALNALEIDSVNQD